MERVHLPSKRAVGLDMPGMKYDTRRGLGEGVVEVSDADAALLRAYTGLHVGEQFAAPRAPGVVCEKCSFEQYAAMGSSTCPKCGGLLTADAGAGPVLPSSELAESGRRVKVYDI